ncbi:hypothetical protein FACS189499_10230 [Clostridia bacterium]|nr:hypothetical protein FACS189499_10230 [Clostridia bacterium]
MRKFSKIITVILSVVIFFGTLPIQVIAIKPDIVYTAQESIPVYHRNKTATFTFKGEPNSEYLLVVKYLSTSTAKGLKVDKKSLKGGKNGTSDDKGNVTWSWKVGGNTTKTMFKNGLRVYKDGKLVGEYTFKVS